MQFLYEKDRFYHIQEEKKKKIDLQNLLPLNNQYLLLLESELAIQDVS
jgi:hypothetical protein